MAPIITARPGFHEQAGSCARQQHTRTLTWQNIPVVIATQIVDRISIPARADNNCWANGVKRRYFS